MIKYFPQTGLFFRRRKYLPTLPFKKAFETVTAAGERASKAKGNVKKAIKTKIYKYSTGASSL